MSEALIQDIAAKVKSSECILFLGSGVHSGPPNNSKYVYSEEQRPPLGGSLSRMLAANCNFTTHFPNESTGNLQRVALCYEVYQNRQKLVQELRNAVYTDKSPSPIVKALAKLPFKLIITSNYDQLFEMALRLEGKNPIIEVYNPKEHTLTRDYMDPTIKEPFIFKMHGDIFVEDSIVITDEDYIRFVLRMNDNDPYYPVPLTFRYNFMRWPTLFVGYSLLDYNLRLLFQTLRWKIDKAKFPNTYSVDPFPDPLIIDVLQNRSRYVTFIAEDVWNFVPNLYTCVKGEEMPG
jgi:hypothetical protein